MWVKLTTRSFERDLLNYLLDSQTPIHRLEFKETQTSSNISFTLSVFQYTLLRCEKVTLSQQSDSVIRMLAYLDTAVVDVEIMY